MLNYRNHTKKAHKSRRTMYAFLQKHLFLETHLLYFPQMLHKLLQGKLLVAEASLQQSDALFPSLQTRHKVQNLFRPFV